MRHLLIILLLLNSNNLLAYDLEGAVAASYTNYKESKITTSGASANFRWNHSSNGAGWALLGNFPGSTPLLGDLFFGYRYKKGSDYYFEAMAGVRYGTIWGPGIAALLGVGAKLSSRWYISIPVVYKHGLWIEVAPYIGRTF